MDISISDFPAPTALIHGRWAPIYLEPVMGSGERITIGVAAVAGCESIVLEASELTRLSCLYGEKGDGVVFLAQAALDAIRTDFEKRKEQALQDPKSPIIGMHFGEVREGAAQSLEELARSRLAMMSSLEGKRDRVIAGNAVNTGKSKPPIPYMRRKIAALDRAVRTKGKSQVSIPLRRAIFFAIGAMLLGFGIGVAKTMFLSSGSSWSVAQLGVEPDGALHRSSDYSLRRMQSSIDVNGAFLGSSGLNWQERDSRTRLYANADHSMQFEQFLTQEYRQILNILDRVSAPAVATLNKAGATSRVAEPADANRTYFQLSLIQNTGIPDVAGISFGLKFNDQQACDRARAALKTSLQESPVAGWRSVSVSCAPRVSW